MQRKSSNVSKTFELWPFGAPNTPWKSSNVSSPFAALWACFLLRSVGAANTPLKNSNVSSPFAALRACFLLRSVGAANTPRKSSIVRSLPLRAKRHQSLGGWSYMANGKVIHYTVPNTTTRVRLAEVENHLFFVIPYSASGGTGSAKNLLPPNTRFARGNDKLSEVSL